MHMLQESQQSTQKNKQNQPPQVPAEARSGVDTTEKSSLVRKNSQHTKLPLLPPLSLSIPSTNPIALHSQLRVLTKAPDLSEAFFVLLKDQP